MGFNANGRKPRVQLNFGVNSVLEETTSVVSAVEEPVEVPTPVKVEKRVYKKKSDVKPVKVKKKVDMDNPCSVLSLRVSEHFREAVKVYCHFKHLKEKELVSLVFERLNADGGIGDLFSIKYDTNKQGKDTSKRMSVAVSESENDILFMASLKNKVAKSFIMEQAIAREISYKKTI